MTIGEKIKNRRLELGISQEELALRLDYTDRSTISKIESNNTDITVAKLKQFADVLGLSVAYLMDLIDCDRCVSVSSCPINSNIDKALKLYYGYSNAIPKIQTAVDGLLHIVWQDS